ncbi:transposase [Spirillospora sp. CA-253888]
MLTHALSSPSAGPCPATAAPARHGNCPKPSARSATPPSSQTGLPRHRTDHPAPPRTRPDRAPGLEAHNISHRKARARVEHTFARMKTWKFLRDCRLEGDGVHHAMLSIARLHNLALSGWRSHVGG